MHEIADTDRNEFNGAFEPESKEGLDLMAMLKEFHHEDSANAADFDLMSALLPVADDTMDLMSALAPVQNNLISAIPSITETREYNPDVPPVFQSCDLLADLVIVKKAINEEFPIFMGYLKKRLRKELDKNGIDILVTDLEELASKALVRMWKRCKSKTFILNCYGRGIRPLIIIAIFRSARKEVLYRYGSYEQNDRPQQSLENGIKSASDDLDTIQGSRHETVLDTLVEHEELAMTPPEAAIMAAEIKLQHRINWSGYKLETQIDGLFAALTN